MKPLELSAGARADLVDIWTYTSARWGSAQAERYSDRLNDALVRIAGNEMIGSRAVVPAYRKLAIGSHIIFYRIDGDQIRVARILHASMDAARHLRV